MILQIDEITRLYTTYGAVCHHSDGVSQLQHALQCGQLAEEAGSPNELVAAALLHDLGSLLASYAERMPEDDDDGHQYAALPFLRGLFPDAVLEPIRLHVDAKRYCSAVDSDLWTCVTPAAQRRMTVHGGPFTAAQTRAFRDQPFAWDAIALCRWDALARNPLSRPPLWSHFRPLLENLRLALPPSASAPMHQHLHLRFGGSAEHFARAAIIAPKSPVMCR